MFLSEPKVWTSFVMRSQDAILGAMDEHDFLLWCVFRWGNADLGIFVAPSPWAVVIGHQWAFQTLGSWKLKTSGEKLRTYMIANNTGSLASPQQDASMLLSCVFQNR